MNKILSALQKLYRKMQVLRSFCLSMYVSGELTVAVRCVAWSLDKRCFLAEDFSVWSFILILQRSVGRSSTPHYLHGLLSFSFHSFEPAREIMALFVLRKLFLKTRMLSHPVGLDVWFFVTSFVYFHTSCERTAYVIRTIISWAGSFEHN